MGINKMNVIDFLNELDDILADSVEFYENDDTDNAVICINKARSLIANTWI
jgi:hypothetical protein